MILQAALIALVSAGAPVFAAGPVFQELLSGGVSVYLPLPAAPQASAGGFTEAEQYLPPDNDEPGFEWPANAKAVDDNYFHIGNTATYLRATPADNAILLEGAGKCALKPDTSYKTTAKPGFEGLYMTVALAGPLPDCQLAKGYVYMEHVSSSSAGGAWELPRNVRAFMDTLAFAEGTRERYNYIYSFVTFNSYAGHPRRNICAGKHCSTAAGRYQFLARTWYGLVTGLDLSDFTPPSQEKAALELIRRAGAYPVVSKSSRYENFTAALEKLNGIWTSLPGSRYGQPTHSTAELWKAHKIFLARY